MILDRFGDLVVVLYELPLRWKLAAMFLILCVVAVVTVPVIRYTVGGIYAISTISLIAYAVIALCTEEKDSSHALK